MSMELFEVAVLVAEHAANAKGTLLRVVEGPTILGLEAVTVALDRSACELLLTVSKIALFLVSTNTLFRLQGLISPVRKKSGENNLHFLLAPSNSFKKM